MEMVPGGLWDTGGATWLLAPEKGMVERCRGVGAQAGELEARAGLTDSNLVRDVDRVDTVQQSLGVLGLGVSTDHDLNRRVTPGSGAGNWPRPQEFPHPPATLHCSPRKEHRPAAGRLPGGAHTHPGTHKATGSYTAAEI